MRDCDLFGMVSEFTWPERESNDREPSLSKMGREKKTSVQAHPLSPGSPNTKRCLLVVGNPLDGSSQRLFFVWSWTSRVSPNNQGFH